MKWYLILVFVAASEGGTSTVVIPQPTVEACNHAAAMVVEQFGAGSWSSVLRKAACIPGGISLPTEVE